MAAAFLTRLDRSHNFYQRKLHSGLPGEKYPAGGEAQEYPGPAVFGNAIFSENSISDMERGAILPVSGNATNKPIHTNLQQIAVNESD